jgi:hypothetical protein
VFFFIAKFKSLESFVAFQPEITNAFTIELIVAVRADWKPSSTKKLFSNNIYAVLSLVETLLKMKISHRLSPEKTI